MLRRIFFVLGFLWIFLAVRDYLGHGGPGALRATLPNILLAALNFAIAAYLTWRQNEGRREGTSGE
jgi:apolipoprotein N-acyltransferase